MIPGLLRRLQTLPISFAHSHSRFVATARGVVTCIPIHNLIRQLSIPLHRPQPLPSLPIQRILRPLLRRTERSFQAAYRAFPPAHDAFVVCLEQDAHAVDDGVCAF